MLTLYIATPPILKKNYFIIIGLENVASCVYEINMSFIKTFFSLYDCCNHFLQYIFIFFKCKPKSECFLQINN